MNEVSVRLRLILIAIAAALSVAVLAGVPAAQAEAPPIRACSDGFDNDGDGLVDYPADPGCANAKDRDEFNAAPPPPPPPAACADGADNDGDGLVDYPADPGCSSASDTDEANAPPPPPPGDWVHIADEWQNFTLSEETVVRFGKDASWNVRTLAAGTYECSYFTFPPDPAVGVFKECQAQTDDPPPPPPPGDLYFNGDFETGNLSQFQDFHDAHLSRTPPGIQVVPKPGGGYMARVNVTQEPDSSDYGDASMLWEGSGGNAYSLPYLQNGQTTWFRIDFLVPNGQNSSYPGVLNPAPGSFNTVQSWHTNPGVVPTAYSTNLGPFGGGGVGNTSDPACLRLLVRGGPGEGIATGGTWYQTDGAAQTQANRVPLKFNHWYRSVIKLKFGTDSSTGHVEWYVDGVLQVSASVATYPSGGGGLGHEAGLYRGPTKPGLEVLYMDTMRSGPTRASVEG